MTAPLQLSRTYPHPPSRLWWAWTTAEGLAGWWWGHWVDTTHDVDARVGGGYRITSPAHGVGVRGEYLDLDEPHRIAMTWVWLEQADGAWSDGDVEHVTVTFTDSEGPDGPDGGTRVDVEHRGDWADDAPAEGYRQGWEFVLDALAGADLGEDDVDEAEEPQRNA